MSKREYILSTSKQFLMEYKLIFKMSIYIYKLFEWLS